MEVDEADEAVERDGEVPRAFVGAKVFLSPRMLVNQKRWFHRTCQEQAVCERLIGEGVLIKIER